MSSTEGIEKGLFDYLNEPAKSTSRKVSYNSDGNNVVNEGDTSLFQKTENDMGKDQFLNLLIAQLRYQDPLNPAEDTQFVTQLAQFSQLEFTQNSTAAIASLANNMQAFMDLQNLQAQSITNASATPLLGKEVRVMETTFKHKGLSEREFNVHVLEGSSQGNLVIKDEDGNVVAEIGFSLDDSKGGDTTVKWNGRNTETGDFYLGGKYSAEVKSIDGSKAVGYAYQEGTVTGVSFNSGGAALTINDIQYGLGFLVEVKEVGKA